MSIEFDFDRVIDRRSTASNKWKKYDKDVLPLWVADMDFASPEPVVRALRERAAHGVFGYVYEEPEFFEVASERIGRRYAWRVGPESVVMLPGVIAGLNMAVFHIFTFKSVAHWDRDVPTLLGAKIAGGLSMLCWIVVVFCGRWIGFTVM